LRWSRGWIARLWPLSKGDNARKELARDLMTCKNPKPCLTMEVISLFEAPYNYCTKNILSLLYFKRQGICNKIFLLFEGKAWPKEKH
jgi:hypothetical protein